MDEMRVRIACSERYDRGPGGMGRRDGAVDDMPLSGMLGKRYLNSAAKLAIMTSKRLPVVAEGLSADDIGLCVATFGSHFEHAAGQYLEIKNAERPMVSPMLGPNNIPNAVSAQLAIQYSARAFALTFCDIDTAGFEAFVFAVNAILRQKAVKVLVVGTESRPPEIESKIGGNETKSGIHDSVALLLSRERDDGDDTIKNIYYRAHGRAFLDFSDPDLCRAGISLCLNRALDTWGIKRSTLDAVFLGAPDPIAGIELDAVRNLMDFRGTRCFPADSRSKAGRCISALIKAHYAAKLIADGFLPEGNAHGSSATGKPEAFRNVLINDFGQDGTMGCLIISSSGR